MMMMMIRLCFTVIFIVSNTCHSLTGYEPEQIHLALGESTRTITITWVTQQSTSITLVNYTESGRWKLAQGSQKTFVDGGEERRSFFIHRVQLDDLTAETIYNYTCGSPYGWSRVYSFRVLPEHPFWSPRLAVLGDMGITNNIALPELIREITELNSIDTLFHVGDFAYNMDTDNGRYGDVFMRQIEEIAARVPYMTAVGNHELAYNFSHYKARFSMPGGDEESQFYSFDLGPAHIIMFSSEFYYYLYYGWKQVIRQYEWLKRDLEEANKPINRIIRPWIIAMAHRPMYCSNSNDPMHCETVDNLVRTGFRYEDDGKTGYSFGLEELFYTHGVDVIIGAHEHSYERFWPVYNRTVCNGSTENPYFNPPAPVHLVTGSAGCSEGVDPFLPVGKPWSAFRSDDYGFTRITIHNASHMSFEQLSVQDGYPAKVIDAFTIVSMSHGPKRFTCHYNEAQERIPMTLLQPALQLAECVSDCGNQTRQPSVLRN